MMVLITAAAAALTSSSRWEINYGQTECRLSRAYGTAVSPVVVSLKGALGTDGPGTVIIDLIVPDEQQGKLDHGLATIDSELTGPQKRSFASIVAKGDTRRVIETTIDLPKGASVTDLRQMHVQAGATDIAIVLDVTVAAAKAYQRCYDDLLTEWGVDPAIKDKVAVPAKPTTDVAQWVTNNDYPREALRRRLEGEVRVAWTVDVHGRVTDCKTVVPSGVKDLDEHSCDSIVSRGRYKPAIDKDGHPIATRETRLIRWRAPGI